jgi:two-component system response regulator
VAADVAILLVEDSADDRELALRALHEVCEPARIVCAEDGKDALDFMLARGAHAGRDIYKQPRLVILDLTLKQLHGLDVLKAMRADPVTLSIPVVMLTGASEKTDLDRCYTEGANSVVRKSVDFEETRRKLKQVYEFWITVNEAGRSSRV